MPKRTVVAVLLALSVAACSGGGGGRASKAPPTQPPILTGKVTLQPEESIGLTGGYFRGLTDCDGSASLTGQDRRTRTFFGRPASEVVAGTSVTVADDKGQTIGVGKMDAGKWVEYPTNTNLTEHRCEMSFSVQLSRPSPFYAVTVGSQPVQQFASNSPVALTFRGTGTLAV